MNKENIPCKLRKQILCFHVQQYTKPSEYGRIRLSYDMDDSFSDQQIAMLKNFASEVNNRFPDIKMSLTGTGYDFEQEENITE